MTDRSGCAIFRDMPRKARIDAPGALHHLIVRGIERRKIFRDDRDREDFLDRLSDALEETSTSCYAWALMPNHAHFLLRTGTSPLSTVMRRVLTGYAVTFNLRYRRHGQLFQNRYKSILCQEDAYLLELVRYIHLNPLRGGLVREYSELSLYPFCGHSVVMGKRKRDWQDAEYVLSFFGDSVATAKRRYQVYVFEGIEKGRRPDLMGGGLIRSAGGWSEVRSSRSRLKGDERILGDSDFVGSVLREAQELFERRYALKEKGVTLETLAAHVSDLFDVKTDDIFAKAKHRRAVEFRSLFCYWAVRELGQSETALAKRMGITQAAVSISVRRGEKIAQEKGFTWLQS